MVDMLNESGFEKHVGKKADFQLADRLIRQYLDYYAGQLYCQADDKYYQGQHQAMITVEQMHRIIAVRDGTTKQGPKKERFNPEFPLRRTVLCSSCSHALTGSTPTGRKGKRYPSYHCYNKNCALKGLVIRKHQVEKDFQMLLTEVTPAPWFVDYLSEVINRQLF